MYRFDSNAAFTADYELLPLLHVSVEGRLVSLNGNWLLPRDLVEQFEGVGTVVEVSSVDLDDLDGKATSFIRKIGGIIHGTSIN